MEYIVVRLYDASDTGTDVDELCRMAAEELAPRLVQQDGILRYTIFEIDDRRYGSTTLCRGHQVAETSSNMAAEWVGNSPAMQALRLVQRLEGERFYAHQGSGSVPRKGAFGTMRVWQSSVSTDEFKQAVEQELDPLFKEHEGVLRVSMFKAEQPNTFVSLGVHRDPESNAQLDPKATAARLRGGALLAKVMPNAPELTTATIYDTFAR